MAKKTIPPGFTPEEREAFTDEIMAEMAGSERAVVLTAGAMIDELLRRLLFKYFADGPVSHEILDGGPNAPLGSFSARIKLAFAIGLITDQEMKALDTIRAIRNDFAHKLRADIETDRYTDRLQTSIDLVSSYKFLSPIPARFLSVKECPFKEAFYVVAIKLCAMLVRRLKGAIPPPGRGVGKPSL